MEDDPQTSSKHSKPRLNLPARKSLQQVFDAHSKHLRPTTPTDTGVNAMETEQLNLIIVGLRARIQELESMKSPTVNDTLKKERDDLMEKCNALQSEKNQLQSQLEQVNKQKNDLEHEMENLKVESKYAIESKAGVIEENKMLKEMIDHDITKQHIGPDHIEELNKKLQCMMNLNAELICQINLLRSRLMNKL
jgi:chromosome segregation ATPase